jgi:hypothetical protein
MPCAKVSRRGLRGSVSRYPWSPNSHPLLGLLGGCLSGEEVPK